MWLDVRPKKRAVGRPPRVETGNDTIGMDLAPYPPGVPDPWRNRLECRLFWHMAGGAVIAIATARLQGAPDHSDFRTQQIATLTMHKRPDQRSISYVQGARTIKPEAVDTSWTYGVDIVDPDVRRTVEVAAHACHLEMRLRMLDLGQRGINEEIDV